ncbi:DUF4240 domain-containing protein [Streptomyces sp. NPDC007883]|uniref:DUF4240 domain-containing protein n=1 Tax=Streptomyces sp. NPDC007883 TaxID=3155116 RepID=UPI00341123D7
MDVDEFWSFIESARSDDRPFAEALAERLAARSAEQILEFQERFDALEVPSVAGTSGLRRTS